MVRIAFLFLLVFSVESYAAIDAYPFPNDELRLRHIALIDELRCPQCLNTNLAGSDSMIAKDLRREVHRLLLEGKTDDEILDYMYQRYGDFILYKPRLQGGTLVLWFGPVFLLLLAFAVLFRLLRGSKALETELSEADSRRLEQLVKRK
ncbi:MAG: cytochrome c-type biogenesis protein CcmH [Gammaproteobacteria bacterium]|jgi:cytochrome c-type biogenesis protein CcmH|nr:cytochrome c-type biogenesis protein CcmH [Gammaproteobacteria bacterium]|tara:strand:- start:822 stop:1268 length:447 start_codon:yes stop_codon:yes gene_type:complete